MGGIPPPQCWGAWTSSHAPLLWKQPFRYLLAWASLQTFWARPSPNLEGTLSAAKPDWGIPLLSTKPESYGGALSVQMYELMSPNEGPLPIPHIKSPKISTESMGDLGSERNYSRPSAATRKTTQAQAAHVGTRCMGFKIVLDQTLL